MNTLKAIALVLWLAGLVLVCLIRPGTGTSQVNACAIKPGMAIQYGQVMTSTTETKCRVKPQRLEIYACLIRYPSLRGSADKAAVRHCTTVDNFYQSSLKSTLRVKCQYTTYLYSWRTSAYARAFIKGRVYPSPTVLSEPRQYPCE